MGGIIALCVIIALAIAIQQAIKGEKKQREEREHRRFCKNKEYLEKNPIPYAIAELVPNSIFLITLPYPPEKPIDWEIDKQPLLQMGVEELQKKFEILHITQKYIDKNRMEVSCFGGDPALYAWVKLKS